MRMHWIGLIALALGCGGAGPRELVQPRKVPSASGVPAIARITDLGDLGALPAQGAMPRPDSDGVIVVGELVLIEGSDFGKQPTINIGGRPAAAVARTGSGGIIARIPPGVPTGRIDVEVSHPGGRDAMAVDVRRYGFVVQPGTGKVHVVTLGADGAVAAAGGIAVAGARDVALSYDGQVALVAAERDEGGVLAVIATTTSGGPRLVRELGLSHAARLVTCAAAAPLGAVAGAHRITPLSLSDPRNPALYDPMDPGAGAAPSALELSPDGKVLAVLMAEGNRLIPVDMSNPAAPRPRDAVALLPDARVPLARDLGFSPSGDEIWVLAGDNAEALRAGTHATQLVTVSATGGFAVQRAVEITDAGAPMALAVARRESVQSGAAIQSRSRRAAIALAALDRALLHPGGAVLEPGSEPVQVMHTDLDGDASTLARDAGAITALAMSADASFVAGVVGHTVPNKVEIGLLVVPLRGGQARFTGLETVDAMTLEPGSVALSP